MVDASHASMHDLERWDDLRYFLACVEEGSFSAAARGLRVEQSTVSRRIASLEKQLGGALFKRTPEGVALTPLAERVLVEARAIEAHLAAIVSQARTQKSHPVGIVRVAITESMAVHLLLPKLLETTSTYPGLRFELVTGVTSSDLIRGEAEIALRFVRPTRGDLVAKKMADIPFAVFASASYWEECKGRPWQEQRWLTVEFPFFEVLERIWFDTHVSCEPFLVAGSYLSVFEGVRLGLGLGLLPQSAKKIYPGLVEVEVPFPLPEAMELWLVTHQALRHTARISAVWSELEDMCQLLST